MMEQMWPSNTWHFSSVCLHATNVEMRLLRLLMQRNTCILRSNPKSPWFYLLNPWLSKIYIRLYNMTITRVVSSMIYEETFLALFNNVFKKSFWKVMYNQREISLRGFVAKGF